ncbi:MAG: hypothetical protein GF311_26590 [Candidatus Lokiarchaeota archaeon]|nr:hypothetical protein [Candidatus Lokiarchaeota archaeon]
MRIRCRACKHIQEYHPQKDHPPDQIRTKCEQCKKRTYFDEIRLPIEKSRSHNFLDVMGSHISAELGLFLKNLEERRIIELNEIELKVIKRNLFLKELKIRTTKNIFREIYFHFNSPHEIKVLKYNRLRSIMEGIKKNYNNPPEKTTSISTGKSDPDYSNEWGKREGSGSPPSSDRDSTSGPQKGDRMDPKALSREIERTKSEMDIFISRHSWDHFKSIELRLDPINKELDKKILEKIEKNYNITYDRSKNAYPINKQKQSQMGLCFNIHLNATGYMKFHIKKGLKDVGLFLNHFYNKAFPFLRPKEHKYLIELMQDHRSKKKKFEYVHLANKIGPKQVVDESLKGAHIRVKYARFGDVDIKIDYSDLDDPEFEVIGSEPESRIIRDLIVKPAECIPSIMGTFNYSKKNNELMERIEELIINLELEIEINHSEIVEILKKMALNLKNQNNINLDLLTLIYKIEQEKLSRVNHLNSKLNQLENQFKFGFYTLQRGIGHLKNGKGTMEISSYTHL